MGSQTSARGPRPEQYRTAGEYLWARRQWKRTHGGSIIVTVAITFMFVAWTGSQVLLSGLVAFAVVATLIARRPP
jgi:asparagine N-glycosylation enzyme membrane subunit Stt3